MYKDIYHNFNIDGTNIDKLYVYCDDNREPIILPSLWLIQMGIKQEVWGWHTTGNFDTHGRRYRPPKTVELSFRAEPVSENTLDNYVGHVYKLLEYINQHPNLSVHHTEKLTTRFLNYYLNTILPDSLGSLTSLKAHQSGIAAYCNFLCALGIWPKDYSRSTTIYRKTRQYMAEKDTRPLKINYVATYEYNELLRCCSCKRDRLILQMGYEVGLRASENCGLELNDRGKHKGLRSIFEELTSRPEKMEWEYTLRGYYTKGKKTGKIYFDRELLEIMKSYHDNERASIVEESEHSEAPTLFVREDPKGRGFPIGVKQASTIFCNVKKQLAHINQELSYHDLRHTFATKLFHEELKNPEGQETRSESAALEVVRQRLRHSEGSTTVHRYIRLRNVMLTREHKEFA